MTTGTIYGRDEPNVALQNTAPSGSGAALLNNGGTADYGSGSNPWTPFANIIEDTIKYLNGAIVTP